MLPWYEFCLFVFFTLDIHYIIAWYAQISWTPTYHITVPAARRDLGYIGLLEPREKKTNLFYKYFIFMLNCITFHAPKGLKDL
jgi:hypothetical protein